MGPIHCFSKVQTSQRNQTKDAGQFAFNGGSNGRHSETFLGQMMVTLGESTVAGKSSNETRRFIAGKIMELNGGLLRMFDYRWVRIPKQMASLGGGLP